MKLDKTAQKPLITRYYRFQQKRFTSLVKIICNYSDLMECFVSLVRGSWKAEDGKSNSVVLSD